MARYSQYIDQYPDLLPSSVHGVTLFEPPEDNGSFFEQFLALQANPNAAIMQKMRLPDRLKQFMALSGGQ